MGTVKVMAAHGLLTALLLFEPKQDAAFNKTTRSLQDLQLKDLGVKPEFRSV